MVEALFLKLMAPLRNSQQILFSFLVSLLFFSFSCGGTSTKVPIKGQLIGSKHALVLLKEPSEGALTTIDSTQTDALGYFHLSLEVNTPTFYILQVEGEVEPIVLLLEPKDNITISAQKGRLSKTYTIDGSHASNLTRTLNNQLNHTVSVIDSLSRHFRASRDSSAFHLIKKEIDSVYLATIENHRQFTIQFIKSNRYSLSAILALQQQYDPSRAVLNQRKDFELFQLVDSSLYPLYPNNTMVKNLHENVKSMGAQLRLYDKRNDMLELGEKLPNLQLPTIHGDTIVLWSLRKNYVLVDFWATWCNECKERNIKLQQIHQTYSSKGFEVVQIAVDGNKEAIIHAMAADSISWVVIADFLHWDSPLLDSLSINSIPANYLVDRNWNIIERNISNKQLESLLEGK